VSRRRSTTLRAPLGLALLLWVATGCDPYGSAVGTISGVPVPPGAVRIEVRFDPAWGGPPSCVVLRFSYVAARTGDAAGGPAASVSAGDAAADDTERDVWCPGSEAFTFPDRFGIMQGTWEISLKVVDEENMGGPQFEGTCSGVPIRSDKLHVILFTQPAAATSATCAFSF
jgi:hypothetical protein